MSASGRASKSSPRGFRADNLENPPKPQLRSFGPASRWDTCPYVFRCKFRLPVQAGASPAHRAAGTAALQNRGGFDAELVESVFQLGGDVRRLAMLDVAALHHVDDLTVA